MKRATLLLMLLMLLNLCYSLIGESFVERRFPYKPEDVLKASKFVKKPGYWEGYGKDNKLIGYVILSNDWTKHLVGYSSKPLETLIGMDTNGVVTGVKIVAYSEPIFMIGIKDSDYKRFLEQYIGKNIKDNLTIGREITMDAITGATVSALVQNATILGSTRGVAAVLSEAQRPAGKEAKKAPKRPVSEAYAERTWDELVNSGAVKHILVTSRELGMKGAEEIYVDLYFGIAAPPSIGKNILGDRVYAETRKSVKEGESFLVVFAKTGSFKGAGFAYGGIFSTFNVEQDGKIFIFTTEEYENVPDIGAKGAPHIREGGVFIVRGKDAFDQTRPFKFNLTLPYYVEGKKTYKTLTADYKLPEQFMK